MSEAVFFALLPLLVSVVVLWAVWLTERRGWQRRRQRARWTVGADVYLEAGGRPVSEVQAVTLGVSLHPKDGDTAVEYHFQEGVKLQVHPDAAEGWANLVVRPVRFIGAPGPTPLLIPWPTSVYHLYIRPGDTIWVQPE